MLGKLLGAFAGAEAAKHTAAIGGPTGGMLGVVAAPLLRRLSIPGLIVLGAGGYLAKRYYDKREARQAAGEDTPAAVRRAARKARRKSMAAA